MIYVWQVRKPKGLNSWKVTQGVVQHGNMYFVEADQEQPGRIQMQLVEGGKLNREQLGEKPGAGGGDIQHRRSASWHFFGISVLRAKRWENVMANVCNRLSVNLSCNHTKTWSRDTSSRVRE